MMFLQMFILKYKFEIKFYSLETSVLLVLYPADEWYDRIHLIHLYYIICLFLVFKKGFFFNYAHKCFVFCLHHAYIFNFIKYLTSIIVLISCTI